MQPGSPPSVPSGSPLEVRPLPRRPRRLTFGTGEQAEARAGVGAADPAAAGRDPSAGAPARRGAHRAEPGRPVGPLARAAAVLVVAVVSLLVLKQWLALPEPVRPEPAPFRQVLPERALPERMPRAEAGQGAPVPPAAEKADRPPDGPVPPSATSPAAAAVAASADAARNGSESTSPGREPAAVRAQPAGPAAMAAGGDAQGSRVARPPAMPPADSAVRPAASSSRSGRAVDRSPSEAAPARSRPAPAACHGASGLALAQCRACARLDVLQRAFCNERTRLTYCAGRYGRTADCPAPAVTTPN